MIEKIFLSINSKTNSFASKGNRKTQREKERDGERIRSLGQ